jgi:hypothetical protein
MGPENVAEFGTALRAVSGADVAEALGGLVSPAGKAALAGEFAGFIASAFRTAVSEGIAGWETMTWRSPVTGACPWASRRRPSESPSGRQTRTGWSRSRTASGWPRTSRAHLLPGEGHLTLTVTAIGVCSTTSSALAGLS